LLREALNLLPRESSFPFDWTGLHGRAVLLISLPALTLLSSEELQALVAHEIAHEYVWQQYANARTRRDAKRLRELELVCDAIAMATLIRLDVPPERLEPATEKVFSYNRERLGEALNTGSYPSPLARKQLIKKMSVCCLGKKDPTPPSANEQLFVHLYNLADVGAQILHHAIQHATVVLATAGVTAVWQQGAAHAKEAHTVDLSSRPADGAQDSGFRKQLVLIVVRGVPSGYLAGALGRAFPEALTGVNGMIFYDRIEHLKQSDEIDAGTVLGLAMAHEIGHVLLRSVSHSQAGIMKSPWTKADLQHATARLSEFTALQRSAIRHPAGYQHCTE
jgi:hypothetical protein